jgi:hypothetical protein
MPIASRNSARSSSSNNEISASIWLQSGTTIAFSSAASFLTASNVGCFQNHLLQRLQYTWLVLKSLNQNHELIYVRHQKNQPHELVYLHQVKVGFF